MATKKKQIKVTERNLWDGVPKVPEKTIKSLDPDGEIYIKSDIATQDVLPGWMLKVPPGSIAGGAAFMHVLDDIEATKSITCNHMPEANKEFGPPVDRIILASHRGCLWTIFELGWLPMFAWLEIRDLSPTTVNGTEEKDRKDILKAFGRTDKPQPITSMLTICDRTGTRNNGYRDTRTATCIPRDFWPGFRAFVICKQSMRNTSTWGIVTCCQQRKTMGIPSIPNIYTSGKFCWGDTTIRAAHFYDRAASLVRMFDSTYNDHLMLDSDAGHLKRPGQMILHPNGWRFARRKSGDAGGLVPCGNSFISALALFTGINNPDVSGIPDERWTQYPHDLIGNQESEQRAKDLREKRAKEAAEIEAKRQSEDKLTTDAARAEAAAKKKATAKKKVAKKVPMATDTDTDDDHIIF